MQRIHAICTRDSEERKNESAKKQKTLQGQEIQLTYKQIMFINSTTGKLNVVLLQANATDQLSAVHVQTLALPAMISLCSANGAHWRPVYVPVFCHCWRPSQLKQHGRGMQDAQAKEQ